MLAAASLAIHCCTAGERFSRGPNKQTNYSARRARVRVGECERGRRACEDEEVGSSLEDGNCNMRLLLLLLLQKREIDREKEASRTT